MISFTQFRHAAKALCIALALLGAARPASAQSWPDRPIRVVVPYAAGTVTDQAARLLVDKAAKILNASMFIENRPGASGAIGTVRVMRSPADGYTLLFGSNQTQATNMAVLKDPGYDPIADFTPIARLTVNSQVLAVSAKLNVHSVAELVALAKSSPEPLTFASAGKGTIAHLGGEYLKLQTGVEMTHIPYSDSQLMVDLISGRTSMIVYPYLALKGPIDGKQVIPLAVLDEKRPSWLPNVPTMAELGYPKMVLQSWFALFGPANLPADIVGKLTNAFRQALADPATQATLASTGSNPAYAGPDELKAFNRAEIDRFKDIVTAAHLSFDQ